MIPAVSPATRLIALLGDPVGHSLSPAFQNAAFTACGLDGVYLALRCAPGDVQGLLFGITRAGGGGNVTVPHKQLAADLVQRRTRALERTGACNTFWMESGEVWGDNTDVIGFARAAADLLNGPPRNARVLLIGAGGAARAALCSLIDEGADEVVIVNRSEQRASELRDRFAGSTTAIRVVANAADLATETFDLVVNATSLGLREADPLPLDVTLSPRFTAALDLVYSPDRTRWVRELSTAGIPAADGLAMLLHQGAAAFERWWGRPAPLGAMRAALPQR